MISVTHLQGPQQSWTSAFGAFKDDKSKIFKVISVFNIDNVGIFAVGENGLVR